MNATFLQLLEGMTPAQVEQFRREIIPTLTTLKREIVEGTGAKIIPAWMTSRNPKVKKSARSRSAGQASRRT